MLDIELESEDEDTVIERRRQIRQAIMQKYNQPQTEASSVASTPGRSEASKDSDTVGDEAAKDLEVTLQEAEVKIRQRKESEGRDSIGPAKKIAPGKAELEAKKSSLLAIKAAVRNGDMFCEGDMFGEKYLVSELLESL